MYPPKSEIIDTTGSGKLPSLAATHKLFTQKVIILGIIIFYSFFKQTSHVLDFGRNP